MSGLPVQGRPAGSPCRQGDPAGHPYFLTSPVFMLAGDRIVALSNGWLTALYWRIRIGILMRCQSRPSARGKERSLAFQFMSLPVSSALAIAAPSVEQAWLIAWASMIRLPNPWKELYRAGSLNRFWYSACIHLPASLSGCWGW